MILKCTCSHQYQDETYGKGNRVHNRCKFGTKDGGGGRCTVCGRVKELSHVKSTSTNIESLTAHEGERE